MPIVDCVVSIEGVKYYSSKLTLFYNYLMSAPASSSQPSKPTIWDEFNTAVTPMYHFILRHLIILVVFAALAYHLFPDVATRIFYSGPLCHQIANEIYCKAKNAVLGNH